jgi:hypothetical protein
VSQSAAAELLAQQRIFGCDSRLIANPAGAFRDCFIALRAPRNDMKILRITAFLRLSQSRLTKEKDPSR